MLTPTEQGYWVNEKHARISELIHDYNPQLELVWIPPDQRVDDAPPYAVRHNPSNREPYIVFTIKEDELDHRVLARIYRGDLEHHNTLELIESEERAKEAVRRKELEDAAADRRDFINTVAKSPLHRFRHNGKIIPK